VPGGLGAAAGSGCHRGGHRGGPADGARAVRGHPGGSLRGWAQAAGEAGV